MANQMVALQARAPQSSVLGPAIAQGAQMANMMMQQRAAERQAAQAQQTLDIQAAQEARAAAMAGPQLEKAKADALAASLDANAKQAQLVKRDLGVIQSGDFNAISNWRQRATQLLPDWADILPSAEQIASDRNTQLMIAATVEQIINKEIASPVATLELSKDGMPRSVTVGGFNPEQRPVYDAPEPGAAPTAAPMGAPATAPQMSQATPETLNEVVDIALQTGVMSKTNFDKLLSIAQPESRAKIAAWMQSNNIEVVDEAAGGNAGMRMEPMSYDGQTPQSEFAVYRGQPMQSQVADLRSAPPMQQTLAQTQRRTSTPLQMRNPNISTAPAETPEQAGRRERLGRETPDEVYAKELARARAARVAAKEAGPKPLTPVQEARLRENISKDYKAARSTISMMLDPVAGVVATVEKVRRLTPEQKEAITGYSGYLPSITPGSRSADTAIKNLRGKVTEMGKSAAALTGAIGQMAVQEWRIVSDMIASLDLEGMEAADLDDQLDIIEAQARRAAEITRDAYENQYVEEFARYPGRFELKMPGAAPAKRQTNESRLPRVRNNADFNRLKPGTEFIDPNGERRRKPK
jgi:hypothetical protein